MNPKLSLFKTDTYGEVTLAGGGSVLVGWTIFLEASLSKAKRDISAEIINTKIK